MFVKWCTGSSTCKWPPEDPPPHPHDNYSSAFSQLVVNFLITVLELQSQSRPERGLHSSEDTIEHYYSLERQMYSYFFFRFFVGRCGTEFVQLNKASLLLQPKQSRIWEKSSSTSQKILPLVRATTCSTAAEGMGLTRITSPLSLSMNVLLSHQDSLKKTSI